MKLAATIALSVTVAVPAAARQSSATVNPDDVALAYTDNSGARLLTLSRDGTTVPAARATRMTTAVCSDGIGRPIRYLGLQKGTAASSGRQSARNLPNDEGQLFEVVGRPATPDDTCLLVPDGYLDAHPLIHKDTPTDLSRDDRTRIEQAKGRRIKSARTLQRSGTLSVAVIEFDAVGDSLLGSLVVLEPWRLSFHDMPASLAQGRRNGGCWRVDDDCEFRVESMGVSALFGMSGRPPLIFFTMQGFEGQAIVLMQLKDGRFVDLYRGYRYQSPVSPFGR